MPAVKLINVQETVVKFSIKCAMDGKHSMNGFPVCQKRWKQTRNIDSPYVIVMKFMEVFPIRR